MVLAWTLARHVCWHLWSNNAFSGKLNVQLHQEVITENVQPPPQALKIHWTCINFLRMVFNLVRKHDFTPTCFNFSSLTEVRQKWTDFPCFLYCKQRRFCNVSNNSHCIHQASLAPSLIVYKTFLCWPFQQWKNCLQGFLISLIAIINFSLCVQVSGSLTTSWESSKYFMSSKQLPKISLHKNRHFLQLHK